MLFDAYAKDYLHYHREIQNNSAGEMDQKEMCLRNHLLPYFAGKTFDSIGKREVAEYAAAKRRQKLSPVTINHHLTILKSYLRHVEEAGYMEEVPRFKHLKVERRIETNYLTPDECQQIYRAADRHRRPGWRLMMIVAANTGMRIGEMLALNWKNVDMKNGRVYITGSYCRSTRTVKSTKSGHDRHVALTENAHVALRTIWKLEGEPKEGNVMKTNYDTAQRAMAITSKRANIGKEVTWHTLRHTFATALISQGQPLYVVAKLLGHASINMTQRYAHLTRDRSYAAIRDLDGIL